MVQLLLSEKGSLGKGGNLLSSWVAMSRVLREQPALAGFALQRYGNKNKRKNWTKMFENSLRANDGVASPAVAGHSPLLSPSLALPLWREPRQKTFPSSGFADHSLANARLGLQHTRARLSQHFPCKRLLRSAIALSGRKSVLIWSGEVSKYAKLLNAVACYPRKTEE